MKLKTEIVETKQKALIVSKVNHSFIDSLKSQLKKNSIETYFSSHRPKNLNSFDYCFFVNEKILNLNKFSHPKKKIVHIYLNSKKGAKHSNNIKFLKIISFSGTHISEVDLDKILWFTFSETKEINLYLDNEKTHKPHTEKAVFLTKISRYFTKKYIIFISLISLLIFYLSFIPPLILSGFYTMKSFNFLKSSEEINTEKYLQKSEKILAISKGLYSYSRPVFLLFGLALYPDNLIDLSTRIHLIIREINNTLDNGKQIQMLIFKQEKNAADRRDLDMRINRLEEGLNIVDENMKLISQKIPKNLFISKKTKQDMIQSQDMISKLNKMFKYLIRIIKDPVKRKYLIFFANNRELRPGGGFLGSFGIVTIGNYSVSKIEVHDVYDADGQLIAHIEPPAPLRKYLGVPHWFLRDSNYSPDFLDNYQKALIFLEKEINLTEISGGILVTTSAIENVLEAFGDIYLPDYKEHINSQNFYLKTQLHVEKKFFPGSTQKKTFLNALINQLYINIDNFSLKKLGIGLKKSLDEKQIVVYFDDQIFQSFIDSSYWSGRVIEPKCTIATQNCITDYLFPYDTNVGANKANYFINRDLSLKTNIKEDGTIHHLLSVQYKNSSPDEIFPAGYYRNYFQVLIPKDAIVNQVTRDGILVEEIDQTNDRYKTVGFFFEVAPKKSVEVKIEYFLKDKVLPGQQMYQFVIQKQIGAPNSDFVLVLKTSDDTYVMNQNFSPVVKDGEMIYNTNLSTDKIFLVELIKEKP